MSHNKQMTEHRHNAVLQAIGISKRFQTPNGELTVLDDINFEIRGSESVAIVGVSGSGKSTLLALLAGLDSPTSGEIKLNGLSLTNADEDGRAKLRSQYIGFVFQQFHLMPNLSALENVALPLELVDRPDAEAHALAALREVGLADRSTHYPRQLSGGEQQRVALARAFCAGPRILLADEPTGNLDRQTATQISDLLFKLNAVKRTTLVLVTHDERLAAKCERRIRIVDGTIRNENDPLVEAEMKRA